MKKRNMLNMFGKFCIGVRRKGISNFKGYIPSVMTSLMPSLSSQHPAAEQISDPLGLTNQLAYNQGACTHSRPTIQPLLSTRNDFLWTSRVDVQRKSLDDQAFDRCLPTSMALGKLISTWTPPLTEV